MSRRSVQRRQARREKQSRKWSGHEKARQGGASPTGLKSSNFDAYRVTRPRELAGSTGQRTD